MVLLAIVDAKYQFIICDSITTTITIHDHYSPSECFDQENAENGTILPGLHTGDHMIPLHRRDYFSNEGSVPWQKKIIN